MTGLNDPFILSLFPNSLKLIPENNVTSDAWVIGNNYTGNNTSFRTQWIQCSYQVSGSYGPTPRYIYYGLILFTVLTRRRTWIAAVALGSVMTYSATAAVHAFVFAIIRHSMVPKYLINNYELILVQGHSPTGVVSKDDIYTLDTSSLWLPVLPMAWDDDIDPLLAIVGTSYLVLLPMQIWSQTLKNTQAKSVLVLWSALLLVGMVSALIAEEYTDFYTFPQLRFCPLTQDDTLPLTNDGTQTIGGVWDRTSWYHWNQTVSHHFSPNNGTKALSNLCIYPCFESTWPLRDPTDIYVVNGNFASSVDTNVGYRLLVATYVIVSSSALSSATVALMTTMSGLSDLLGTNRDVDKIRETLAARGVYSTARFFILLAVGVLFHLTRIKTSWNSYGMTRFERFRRLTIQTYFLAIYVYAILLSPFALVFFVVYIEWFMWGTDAGGESFRHVGQWGAIVAAVLVFAAAVLSHFAPTWRKRTKNDGA